MFSFPSKTSGFLLFDFIHRAQQCDDSRHFCFNRVKEAASFLMFGILIQTPINSKETEQANRRLYQPLALNFIVIDLSLQSRYGFENLLFPDFDLFGAFCVKN